MATLVSLQIPRTGFKITNKFSLEAILLILTTSDLQVPSLFMMEWEKDKTPAMLGSKSFLFQCSKKDRPYSIKKIARIRSPSQEESRIGKVQTRRDRGNAGEISLKLHMTAAGMDKKS